MTSNRRSFLSKSAGAASAVALAGIITREHFLEAQTANPPVISLPPQPPTGITLPFSGHPIGKWIAANPSKTGLVKSEANGAIRAIAPAYDRLEASGDTSLLSSAAQVIDALNQKLTAWGWQTAMSYELLTTPTVSVPSRTQLQQMADLLNANGCMTITADLLQRQFSAVSLRAGLADAGNRGAAAVMSEVADAFRAQAQASSVRVHQEARIIPAALIVNGCAGWQQTAEDAFAIAAVTEAIGALAALSSGPGALAVEAITQTMAIFETLMAGAAYVIYRLCEL